MRRPCFSETTSEPRLHEPVFDTRRLASTRTSRGQHGLIPVGKRGNGGSGRLRGAALFPVSSKPEARKQVTPASSPQPAGTVSMTVTAVWASASSSRTFLNASSSELSGESDGLTRASGDTLSEVSEPSGGGGVGGGVVSRRAAVAAETQAAHPEKTRGRVQSPAPPHVHIPQPRWAEHPCPAL